MVDADVIVVGAGLAGLVAAAEAADAGRRVLVLDQEPEQSLGGQAMWSFGGLFFVGSPEQRRFGVPDSLQLAWRRARRLRGVGGARLARRGGLRPPGRRVAEEVGARLRRVGRDREAALA